MRRFPVTVGLGLCALLALVLFLLHRSQSPWQEFYGAIEHYMSANIGKVPKVQSRPNDWFYIQRAYPELEIPNKERILAQEQARLMVLQKSQKSVPGDYDTVTWVQAGPTNVPGRIPDLAVDPTQPDLVYAASAAGGLFKTTDGGANWTPIFDSIGTQSIGAVAINPENPNIIYVGTGEANAANDTYDGTGLYKSIDAGDSWSFIGLPNSFRIGRITLDPIRPDTVYVAAAGRLFGTNPERGLYRSEDGGQNWSQVLYLTDSTACIDVAVHPNGTVFAAMWERWRNTQERRVGGLSSGLFRSTDYGQSFTLLEGNSFPGLGLPVTDADNGRIGVSLDPSGTDVYAVYIDHPGDFMGIYRSMDLGNLWLQTNDAVLHGTLGGFGWYFGQVRVVPGVPTTVYSLGVSMLKSVDGGFSWGDAGGGTHVDYHALWINPRDPDSLYSGCDGGANVSENGGLSYTRLTTMPNTQFYAITIDPSNPERLYGGAQDNGTMRTLTGALNDWTVINGGDGFYVLVDPTDPNVIYAEYQNGYIRRSTNGGLSFQTILNNMDYSNERHNWSTPFALDPADHEVLLYGSNILYRTDNRGDSWTPISSDLTDGPDPGNLTFGTITTIDISPLNSNVIWVGTDDANVWVTQNGGATWDSVHTGLPNRWVTRVTADPHNAAVGYVTFSGYKIGSYLPHIFRTTDFGQNWTDITGNLFDTPINDVIVDPSFDSVLYIGSDFGVYVTTDLGQSWAPLGNGMPITPVHDLALHNNARKLVAGTHGRSMFASTMPSAPECSCPCHADPQCDSIVDVFDVVLVVDVGFRGIAPTFDANCPYEQTDVTCDSLTDVFDVIQVVDVAFRSGDPNLLFCHPCGP